MISVGANEIAYPLRLLLHQIPCVLWWTDTDLRLTNILGAIPGLQQLGDRFAVGATLYEFRGTNDPTDAFIAPHLAALAGHRQSGRRQFGERWFEAVVEPLRNERSQIIGCAGAAVDITERREVELSLERSEARLAAAQRIAHVGSFEWNVKDDVVIASDEVYRIYGIDPANFGSKFADFAALLPPGELPLLEAHVFEALHRKGTHRFDHRIIRSDGQIRTLQVACEASTDERGAPLLLIGSVWDVTEMRETTAALEKSISLLRATLEATADGILVVDKEGRVVASNEQFRALWQIPDSLMATGSDEMLLEHVLDQLADPESFLRDVRDHYSDHELESLTILHFKDGRVFERYSRPQRLHGEVVGRVWSFRDVTDRERMLARAQFLSDASRLLTSLDVEKGLEGVARLSVPTLGDGCVVDLLEGGAPRRLFAYSRTSEVPITCELHAAVRAGHLTTYSLGSVSFLSAPFTVQGEAVGAITFISAPRVQYQPGDLELAEDLAVRISLAIENSRLYHAAREALRTREDFLSVVCHEIRTPLTSIHLAAQKLIGRASDPGGRQLLERVIREDRRLARLVDDLIDFGRIQAGVLRFELEEVNLAHVVHETIEHLSFDFDRAGSQLCVELDEAAIGDWDPARLQQVVTNLLTNAIKFGMGRPIHVSVWKTDETAFLRVADQGVGIRPELHEQIFDPFERPAPVRQYGGLGLGLYIARTIVEGLGGKIQVDSANDSGTTITVELPRRKPT